MKKLSNIFIVALVIFSVTVLPYQILRDTIEADWAIIWYSGRRMAMPNFVMLPLLLFPWIYLIYWSCQQLWLKVTAWRKQELEKKQQRERESQRLSLLSSEEKAIQVKLDKTHRNIFFLGFLADKSNQGRFACAGCGYEWQVRIDKIYQRKQCGQCAIRYAKE